MSHGGQSTSAPGLDDRAARRRIREALDESLLVEAAAGTGKTTALVGRLVAMLASGRATVAGVVAVTFTRKAAGELKLRLRQELEVARLAAGESAAAAEAERLEAAIARLEEARIGTIHGLCAELLRERPIAAGVDPGFVELDEETSRSLFAQAFRRWTEDALATMPPGLRRALSRLALAGRSDEGGPLARLEAAAWQLADWRDFPAPWQRRPFDRELIVDQTVGIVRELAVACRNARNPKDQLVRALDGVVSLADWIERSEGTDEVAGAGARGGAGRDYDALEARFAGDLYWLLKRNARVKGSGSVFAPGLGRQQVIELRADLIHCLEQFKQQADGDLAALLREELRGALDAYAAAKRATGRLDFHDLLVLARDLVRDQPAIRAAFQQRITHLFVDEFQDTDPLQAELLLLLGADDPAESDWRRARPAGGKLFLVGDPKQSIYRFRRADVGVYEQVKASLLERGVGLVYLRQSFRAVPPLQRAINGAFAPAMTGDPESGSPSYVALEEARPAEDTQPSLIALPVPEPYGERRISRAAIDASTPGAVAAFLAWLLGESGWTAGTAGGGREALRPSHVAILFRRFVSWGGGAPGSVDVTRSYLDALEARGVPHVLLGGRSFHQREEVETLRAALNAVEWPDDELAVFAFLKGTLCALPDDLLLHWHGELGSLHPFCPLPASLAPELEPVAEALRLLADLHRRRNRVPIGEVIQRLLRFGRAHAAFAFEPAGNQVLANVQRIADRGRAFELGGADFGYSFRGFVERLNEEAGEMGAAPAPGLEEGAEGVRLMTLHTAKGLEFPVVVLADITAHLNRADPDRTCDPHRGLAAARLLGCAPWDLVEQADRERGRDAAEGVRVAYVAATRARDLLVVPAVGDGPLGDSWLSPLDAALYPPKPQYRLAAVAAGCPRFGEASVLERPADAQFERAGEVSVRPGLHRSAAGNEVVWWDPALLVHQAEPSRGLRREDLLIEEGGLAAAGSRRDYQEWRERRERIVAAGARPGFVVERVTDAAAPTSSADPAVGLGAAAAVALERVDGRAPRPRGPRFGTLVHTVLRDTPLGAPRVEIEALARLHGRILAAPDEEVAAAADAVASALAHPLLARAGAARRVWREIPFVLPLGDRRLLEGVIDLAFEEEPGWTVIDFKTDAELAGDLAPYRRQVAWYVEAVARLTGRPASGVLLAV